MYVTSLCFLKKEKKTHHHQKTPQPQNPLTTTAANQQISLLNWLVTGIVKLLPISLDIRSSRYKTVLFFFDFFFFSCNYRDP